MQHHGPGGETLDKPAYLNGIIGLAAIVAAAVITPPSASACGGIDDPCLVPDGQYYAHMPAGWDGSTPLPTAVYFHGWSSSGANVMRNRRLTGTFDALGVLLIAPDGRNNTWAHVGSPSSARDEIAFIDAVMADVHDRWPVDRSRLWVTGFSQGGSMVWDVACYRGGEFAAFAPISGAFWLPLPDTCPAGPVNLLHVHGTADTVVPMEGRPIRQVFRQGDVLAGLAIWRTVNGCSAEPDRVEDDGALTCEIWNTCSGGRELQLCLHDGGHATPPGWLERAYRWVETVNGDPPHG